MDRNEQFIKAVRGLTENYETAVKYAEHLSELFDVIDSKRLGAELEAAVASEDYPRAIAAAAKYFREKPDFAVSELSSKGVCDLNAADKAANGFAREVNIDWEFKNGEMDFLFDPTSIKGPINHEWLWQFNRHKYWANLSRAYTATGEEKYAAAFKRQLLKWIAQTYIPEKWNGPGSAWRTIECGLRLLGNWQVAYDGFRRYLDDVTLLLMIASMHRQSVHLVDHPTKGNWLMMEMNGVYTFSALFWELTDSESNRSVATGHLLRELEAQILPDGMHNELSPDYQRVVFNCVVNFYNLAKNLGMADEIPPVFVELIKKTVNAAINLSTPAFTQPRTNDCFTIPTVWFTKRASEIFGNEPAYEFVNKKRAEGAAPNGETASRFLSYAGFAVMRSDWSESAAYLCFDVGPLGMAHIHQDKLNINIYKGSEELVFDDGGGQYEISNARKYALSGYGHNTVLVDGLAQNRNNPRATECEIDAGWVTNERFDYACGSYEDAFGEEAVKPAKHKREVRFCKPDFFVVKDTLTSLDGAEHTYEPLFHLDTTSVKQLSEYKNGVISDFGRKYEIAIIPLDCECASPSLKTVSAVTEPQMQGWYNGRNESYLHEAITVSREVKGVTDYTFVTLLFPMEKGQALPKVHKDENGTVNVTFNGAEYTFDLNHLDK